MIPFADVAASFAPVRQELDAAIAAILSSGRFAQGQWVERLEGGFQNYLEVHSAVAVSSGTSALELTLRALGAGPGDEVITTPFTFIATAEAICATGATPVFADVDPRTLQIDPQCVRAALTSRTVGILPVHLYGAPAPMDALGEIARAKDLWLVEDACQAHGARYQGRRVGSLGVASCFSFYPGKNLGAAGEGGLVATDDDALAARVRQLRDHGSRAKYHHEVVGVNARMSEIEAASVALKLPLLDEANDCRRAIAERYGAGLAGMPLRIPEIESGGESVHHLFVVQSVDRDGLRDHLDAKGVQTGLHYPMPLHQQPALAEMVGEHASFPQAESAARSVLSLPMFPALNADQIDAVCEHVTAYFVARGAEIQPIVEAGAA